MERTTKPADNVINAFSQEGITDFEAACAWIKSLPYGRNENKEDVLALFHERCGTCSTKHALLSRLAAEMNLTSVQLCMGIYRMNGTNTPPVAPVLAAAGLEYVPEAHVFLRISGEVMDVTVPQGALDFLPDLLEERIITPENVPDDKMRWHRAFMTKWIDAQGLPQSLEEVWAIREACIAALAAVK